MNPKVIYFSPEDSIFEVAKVFSEKDISGAPVVEKGKVSGVISISDIIKFLSLKFKSSKSEIDNPLSLTMQILNLIQLGKNYVQFKREIEKISHTKVRDVMSKKVVFIGPDDTLLEAATKMAENDVNRLPVIENGKLVGIIAREDLVKSLLSTP
ncbi:MAG: CBS domain-containing protein [Candidatus Aenigmatarchaeota archaeon]